MNKVKALPGTDFCFEHLEGALPALMVRHPAFTASLLLQGGQLIRFSPRGRSNWLWLSDQERFIAGKAVRGGIPICWPWFGAPSRNPEAVRRQVKVDKAHGFARLADWSLETIEETPDRVRITLMLDCTAADGEAENWIGHACVRVHFGLSADALEVTLETSNTGAEYVWITQALHSYFPTPDVHRTSIDGLNGQPYVDALRDWRTFEQLGPVSFSAETDRIYRVTGPLQLTTPDRQLQLEPQGSRSAVVWNPWAEKSRTLSHFSPSAWENMFCVETANVLEDAVCLAPGATHRMGLILREC